MSTSVVLVLVGSGTLLSGFIVLGLLSFLVIFASVARHSPVPDDGSRFGWLLGSSAVADPIGTAAWMSLQMASLGGQYLCGFDTDASTVVGLMVTTGFARAFIVHLLLSLVLLFLLFFRQRLSLPLGLVTAVSAINVASLAWVGHAVDDMGFGHDLSLAIDVLHRVAAGVWIGALAGFVVLSTAPAHRQPEPGTIAEIARRFTRLGLACGLALLASGTAKGWLLVGDVPHLIGTLQGRLLLAKIALFLVMLSIAWRNRMAVAPAREPLPAGNLAIADLRRKCPIEFAIGVVVVGIGAALGQMAPAAHEQPIWPLPFRLDAEGLKLSRAVIVAGTAGLSGICLVAAAVFFRRYRPLRVLVGVLLVSLSLPTLFRSLTVAAYPTSFQSPQQPYTAVSVARGHALYRSHCAACHGMNFRGDGELAGSLPQKPADLRAIHVLGHLPGDIFWWIQNGIADAGMPGFATTLTESDRWSLVQFVQTLPVGGLTDGLTGTVSSVAPAAPAFSFESHAGIQRTLDAVRINYKALILAFPRSDLRRLADLNRAASVLQAAGLGLVAVTTDRRLIEAGSVAVLADPSVVDAYRLLVPDSGDKPLEVLVDSAGYARAAWSGEGLPDWTDGAFSNRLVEALGRHRTGPVASHHLH